MSSLTENRHYKWRTPTWPVSNAIASCLQPNIAIKLKPIIAHKLISAFAMEHTDKKTIEHLHEKACAEGSDYYIDPASNRMVFTRVYHAKKGYCCDSGCRHCPYKSQKDSSSDNEEDSQL